MSSNIKKSDKSGKKSVAWDINEDPPTSVPSEDETEDDEGKAGVFDINENTVGDSSKDAKSGQSP